LGDASSIPTSKTAAAIAAQCGVLAYNLAQQINTDLSSTGPSAGVKRFREYDGYTSCPLVTGRGKLILAEFNGFTLEPRETFWFDQGVERSTMYTLKANVLPTVYWDGLLKGVWDGPGAFRKFLNPFNRN
jgi:sulfide:quinone oxidoreductase